MRLNDDYVRYYSTKKQIIDLNKYIQADIKTDDYAAGIIEFPRQADGTYTAWSVGMQPRLIFFNVNHFKEAGVPLPPKEWTDKDWKWDNFLDAAKKLPCPAAAGVPWSMTTRLRTDLARQQRRTDRHLLQGRQEVHAGQPESRRGDPGPTPSI